MNTKAKVIDLAKQKYKRLVLDAFDKLGRERDREAKERRAEVERKSRNQL